MARMVGLHHPAFVTNDMAATTRYWRDLLGMPLVHTVDDAGVRQYFFALGERDYVAFFEYPEAEPIPRHHPGRPTSGPVVFDHLAMEVASEADLWDVVARMDAAGEPITDAIDHGFLTSVYTHDPNGIALEFTVRRPGREPVENPVLAEARPTAEAREGPPPRPDRWPPPDPLTEDEKVIHAGVGHDVFPEET